MVFFLSDSYSPSSLVYFSGSLGQEDSPVNWDGLTAILHAIAISPWLRRQPL